MNNSMRSFLSIIFCVCLAAPLLGMESGEKRSLEDSLNRAAAAYLQKGGRIGYGSGAQLRVPVSVMAGVTSALVFFALTELTEAFPSSEWLSDSSLRCSLFLGFFTGAATYGLEFMTLRRSSVDKEYAERLLKQIICCAQIDESKLTPEAKALLAELRKRVEAKKA